MRQQRARREQVLAHLLASYADRFAYADHSPVERIVLDSAEVDREAVSHVVSAETVVMCTNGFLDHVIEDRTGGGIPNQTRPAISRPSATWPGTWKPRLERRAS